MIMKNKNQDLMLIDTKNENDENEKEIDKMISEFVINVNKENQEKRKKRMKIQS